MKSNTILQVEVLVASPSKFSVVQKSAAGGKSSGGPENEKKICLWPTGNGTTCGKSFAKFDSLKRHLTEAHKGVRPFACKLCDKTYGRRDYLQRHLKSHNASYAVNLAGGNAATLQVTILSSLALTCNFSHLHCFKVMRRN